MPRTNPGATFFPK